VDRLNNTYGDPVLGPDEERWEYEREMMKFPPIALTREQCLDAQEAIPQICQRGRWNFHTCSAAPDHIHVILYSQHEPKAIRRMLKRWLGQSMSEKWPLQEGATWWAESGSIKWLTAKSYFDNAFGCVSRQRRR
jgi:REP element-mobilizing transposase RayT